MIFARLQTFIDSSVDEAIKGSRKCYLSVRAFVLLAVCFHDSCKGARRVHRASVRCSRCCRFGQWLLRVWCSTRPRGQCRGLRIAPSDNRRGGHEGRCAHRYWRRNDFYRPRHFQCHLRKRAPFLNIIRINIICNSQIAAAVHAELGGGHFDRALYELAAKMTLEKHKIDVKSNPKYQIRLLRACEKAKQVLSTVNEAEVTFATADLDVHLIVTKCDTLMPYIISKSLLILTWLERFSKRPVLQSSQSSRSYSTSSERSRLSRAHPSPLSSLLVVVPV